MAGGHDLERYRNLVIAAGDAELRSDPTLGGRLVISASGPLVSAYAPFEYVNPAAKIVILGITPGRRQASDALIAAKRAMLSGQDTHSAARAAKGVASFAGVMRSNIVAMLDHVGLHNKLGLSSTASLFGERADLVHYTSCLRNPVYNDGKDYDGSSPSLVGSAFLRSIWEDTLAAEIEMLPQALWVPLGGKVEAVLTGLAARGKIDDRKILRGLQHASGANAERIAYFLGRKPRELLSNRTNPVKIDTGKSLALETVRALTFP